MWDFGILLINGCSSKLLCAPSFGKPSFPRLHMVKRSDSILAHANQFWKGALEAARQLWKQIVGFEDPQVEEEVCKHILQTYKQYPPILVMSTLGSVVAFQWSMIVGRVMVIPRALCWMILLTLSIGLLLTFQRDRLIKRHTLDYWYCFGALLCTLQLLPGVVPETERLLWSMVTFCFYRLPAVAMAPRLSWAIVANLTYTVVSVVGISLDTEHRTYANGGDRVYVAFWLEALLLILVVGAAFSQRYSVKAFVKQRMLRAIMEPWPRRFTTMLRPKNWDGFILVSYDFLLNILGPRDDSGMTHLTPWSVAGA